MSCPYTSSHASSEALLQHINWPTSSYSEVRSAPFDYTMLKAHHHLPCKICDVSFNIGRVRRPDEPYHTDWSPVCGEPAALPRNWSGARYLENIISKDFVKWRRCDPSTGCQNSERKATSKDRDEKASDDFGLFYENYGDYVYESEEDDKPLEYMSEVASVQDLEAEDADDSASESDGHHTTQLGTVFEKDRECLNKGGCALTNEMDDESKSGMQHQQSKLRLDGSE